MTEPQKKFGRLFLSFSSKNWMINSTPGVFGGVFEICGLIRKSRKTPVLVCNQLSNRSGTNRLWEKFFQDLRINLQILKTFFFCKGSALYIEMSELKSANPEKWLRSEKNASPTAQKWILGPKIIFFSVETCEPSVFCKKRHSIWSNMQTQRLNYDLPLHIGGRHSVLYFIIPATEKFSTAIY